MKATPYAVLLVLLLDNVVTVGTEVSLRFTVKPPPVAASPQEPAFRTISQ